MKLNKMVVWGAGGATAAVVLVVIVLTMVMGGDDSQVSDEDSTLIATVLTSVTADAVVLPVQSADLSMSKTGVVHEIRVLENQIVSEGDVLARLENGHDSSAFAKAQNDLVIAKSKLAEQSAKIGKERHDEMESISIDTELAALDLRDAEANFLYVSGEQLGQSQSLFPEWAKFKAVQEESLANAKADLEQAQEDYLVALGESSTTGIPETSDTVANLAIRTQDVADAEIAVLRAEVVVSEALKLGDVLQDAINDVTAAKNSLANAKWDLDAATAQSALDIRSAQSIADTSEENLRDSYLKWLGIDLTAEEITADPETLYEDWDLVLDEVFSRTNLAYGNGIAPDDPSTRWNEFTVFAWLYLHPLAASVAADCGDTLDIELVGKTCVDRSIENAWDTHLDGQDGLNTAISNGPSSVALAENAIFDADQALTDAENELLQVNAGKSEFDVAYAQGALSAAISARDVLVNYPDPIAVALAKAKLLAAQAALSDKMDWPNAFEIELARSEFTKADSLYARLSAGPNPFDEARRDAVLAEASASVEAAEASLGIAITALNNTEIRAPFDGTVSGVDINIGEETSPDDIAMRIANVSSWEIETDDLDELSVVNLREGDIVTVKFDALPDLDMQGTVASISKFGEQKQGSITYKAQITLNDFDPRLRWNMTATISKTDSGVATSLLR